ncbi:MAG: FaeA/PapI family transcriptional regulator [Gallionella sp.]
MNDILEYLKSNGERLDTDIAKATGIPLAKTRLYLAELTAQMQIMSCHSIRFEDGKKIEGMSCRLTGTIPKAKPGAKPKAQLALS